MKANVARSLAALGVAGALILGSSAPALAAEAEASFGSKLIGAVARTIDVAALESGEALDAESYLGKLEEPVEWMSCGASTYGIGDGLMGSGCSDGSIVTESSMGVAHKTLPFGTQIQIMYNGKVVNATVCDRGPFVSGRDIDLQPAVAWALDFDGVGTLQYRVIA